DPPPGAARSHRARTVQGQESRLLAGVPTGGVPTRLSLVWRPTLVEASVRSANQPGSVRRRGILWVRFDRPDGSAPPVAAQRQSIIVGVCDEGDGWVDWSGLATLLADLGA